jgi:hypothetical protein
MVNYTDHLNILETRLKERDRQLLPKKPTIVISGINDRNDHVAELLNLGINLYAFVCGTENILTSENQEDKILRLRSTNLPLEQVLLPEVKQFLDHQQHNTVLIVDRVFILALILAMNKNRDADQQINFNVNDLNPIEIMELTIKNSFDCLEVCFLGEAILTRYQFAAFPKPTPVRTPKVTRKAKKN